MRAYVELPQRENTAVSAQFLGNGGGKECNCRPAIPAHLIETNPVTSVRYDEQIDSGSTFHELAAAAAQA